MEWNFSKKWAEIGGIFLKRNARLKSLRPQAESVAKSAK